MSPSHVIDSAFFRDLYGTEELRRVFADEHELQCWLDFEAALARAEAAAGLIPKPAAAEITRQAQAELIDLAAIKRGIDETAHPLVPLVRELAAHCSGDAGGYVHWGATTQDVMDTGLILQIKEVHAILARDLTALAETLAGLAQRERDTLMMGRTHGQHATPITFGFKVAVWLAEVQRHIDCLQECAPRVLVGELGGASGTLAAIGAPGLQVQALLMAELGLAEPEIAWHSARDRLAEFVSLLALIATTMGKIAHEVILLQKTEVAEIEEPFQRGKVGSSTMPHKRNPMLCEAIQAQARLARGLAAPMLEAMTAEHERDWSSMHTEWSIIPEASILTGGAVAQTLAVIRGLRVNRERMRANVDLSHGLPLSEAVMMQLAAHVGRQVAHDLIYEAAMAAFEQARPLRDLLLEDPRVAEHIPAADINRLLQPETYTGLCGEFVDRVVQTRTDSSTN